MSDSHTPDDQPRPGLRNHQLDLMHTMFDQAPIFMAVTEGPKHRIRYINPAFRQLLGGRAFPLDTPAADILPDLKAEDEAEVEDSLQRLDDIYASGEPLIVNEFKTRFDRTGEGRLEKAYFNFVYQPLKDARGEIYGLFLAGYEVTGHVKARQQQAHSEQRLQLTLEGANVGFWETDPDFRSNTHISAQCKAHFGRPLEEEFDFQEFLEAIHPEDRPHVLEQMRQVEVQKTSTYEAEYRVRWPDGSEHWLLGRGQCLYDEEGHPYRLSGITVDITRHKQAQQKLQEAVRLRDDFLSVAAHELQTPVTSMKIQAELIERRLRDEDHSDQARRVGKLKRQVDYLAGLMEKLLDMSRMQQQGLALEKESFSLSRLIEETVDTLSHLSHHDIEMEGVAEADILVYADHARLGQVLTNLIENAVKYSSEAKRILVRCRRSDDKAVVSVVDYGIGISEEEKQNVFQRFFKGGGGAKQTYPGFGIGLYITSQIVERHGGDIWVEDNPQGGSVFSFSLPIASP